MDQLTRPEAPAVEVDDEQPGAEDGIGSRMEERIEQAEEANEAEEESTTREGTDSEEAVPPPPDHELESKLALFGQAYLAYDYRVTSETRLAPVQDLVTPDLYQGLITPLPEALTESLIAEHRVVTAELMTVEGIDSDLEGGGVYELSFLVSETTNPSSSTEPVTEEHIQLLTVFVRPDHLIEDVR